jgi:hypothetical protein
MSTENIYFKVEDNGEGKIALQVNGTGKELINLFANVIAESEDMATIIKMAIMAVEMDDKSDNDILSDLMAHLKPEAQA